jgi:hypothetical protein
VYYQTVAKDIADARMTELRNLTSRDFRPSRDWNDNDLYRFSFEDGDNLVHSGRHTVSGRVRAREDFITGVPNAPGFQPRRGRGGYGYHGAPNRGRSGRRGGYQGT